MDSEGDRLVGRSDLSKAELDELTELLAPDLVFTKQPGRSLTRSGLNHSLAFSSSHPCVPEVTADNRARQEAVLGKGFYRGVFERIRRD